jgi:GNAT superfamily N-acetyltransferase
MDIRPAAAQDVNGICEFLHREMAPNIPLERWRALFEYRWAPGRPHQGFVAVQSGKVVGFFGAVFSGFDPAICNLTSWYVSQSVRGTGVGKDLLNIYLSETKFHYTLLTIAAYLQETYKRNGFEILESHEYVCEALPQENISLPAVYTGALIPFARLSELDQKIFRDHEPYGCRFVFLEQGKDQCFLVLKDFKRKKKPGFFCQILYASDYEFLLRYPECMARSLPADAQSLVAADKRFLHEAPANAVLEQLTVPRMFRSTGLSAEARASLYLYSEVVLLNLNM